MRLLLALALLGSPAPVVPVASGYASVSRDDMQLLQYDLAWLGYYGGIVNGLFSQDTFDAVWAFQGDHGLVPDGLPGPDTQALLSATTGP